MSTGYRDCRCLVEGYDQCLCKFCNRCGGLGHTVLYCKRKSHGGRSGGYMSFSRPTKSTPMNDLDQIDNHREPPSHDSPKPPMAIIQASYVSKNDRLSQRSATDEFPTAKRRNWSEVAGSGIETPNLGPVDRTSILEHLISNVRLEMSERYSSVLEEYNIAKILEDSLSPAVKDICEQGKFDLTSLLEIG